MKTSTTVPLKHFWMNLKVIVFESWLLPSAGKHFSFRLLPSMMMVALRMIISLISTGIVYNVGKIAIQQPNNYTTVNPLIIDGRKKDN